MFGKTNGSKSYHYKKAVFETETDKMTEGINLFRVNGRLDLRGKNV